MVILISQESLILTLNSHSLILWLIHMQSVRLSHETPTTDVYPFCEVKGGSWFSFHLRGKGQAGDTLRNISHQKCLQLNMCTVYCLLSFSLMKKKYIYMLVFKVVLNEIHMPNTHFFSENQSFIVLFVRTSKQQFPCGRFKNSPASFEKLKSEKLKTRWDQKRWPRGQEHRLCFWRTQGWFPHSPTGSNALFWLHGTTYSLHTYTQMERPRSVNKKKG